jgi:hypothetical protein
MPSPYIATIVITGICYLVNGNKTVSVVMPNGTEGTPVSKNTAIPPHYAFIRYLIDQTSPKCASETCRLPDFTFTTHDDPATKWGVILLKGETVKYSHAGSGLEINKTSGASEGGADCVTKSCTKPPLPIKDPVFSEREKYSTIVKRADACPQCNDIDSKLLSPKDDKVVNARLDIVDGFLASGAFKKGPKCEWEIKPREKASDAVATQALPQMAVLDVQSADNTLDFTFQIFNSAETNPPLKLQGTDKSRILVLVGNAPLSDIVGLQHSVQETTDTHFNLYYKLISDHLAGHPFPQQKMGSECGKAFVHTGNCPPMQQ